METNKHYFEIDIAKVPKDFSIEKFVALSEGIKIIDNSTKYELEVSGGPLNTKLTKLHVTKEVIDFLDLHDVRQDGDTKYYIINRIEYKYNGEVDE